MLAVLMQSAEELSSMVLTKMKQTAEQYLNKNAKHAGACCHTAFTSRLTNG